MNERMMRVAPKAAAEFITAFSEGRGKVGDSTWLVWAYEGDDTLADLMQARPRPPAPAAGTSPGGLPSGAAGTKPWCCLSAQSAACYGGPV